MNERIAWFWTDLVAGWSTSRRRLALAGLFGAMYGVCAAIALAFDELGAFATDPRWPAMLLSLTLCAYQLDSLPRAIDRLWDSLHPWLVDGDRQIATLRAATRPALARFFPMGAALWLAMVLIWILNGSWSERFSDPRLASALNAVIGLTASWYFLAAAGVFHSLGIWMLLRTLARQGDFRPELLLSGSKSKLRPFNQVLWQAWRFFLVALLLATVGTTLPGRRALRVEEIVLWLVFAVVLILLLSMQRVMNTLLRAAKSRTLARLHDQLDAERVPADSDSSAVLRSLHRVQIVTHDIRTVEAFTPTLVDTRFVVQIALSVAAALIANVLIRTVLSGPLVRF